jgi:pseudaminic acid synthase
MINFNENSRPFIIAEMSGNHNQSLDRAIEIVELAAASGVDAIKLQTYTADTMTIKGAHTIKDPNSLWNGQELHDLYKLAYTPWEWHKPIFDYAKSLGLIAFSSPFDETAVDFLEELDVPLYKVASFENTDHPLLVKVASTGKPVIMSTGAASIAQLDEAVRVLRDNGCKDLTLLKCTSTYPASPENTNIVTIPHLKQLFNCRVGLSDHTLGIGVSIASVAMGAEVIEKHFTTRRADGGVDSTFSMEPEEMKALVVESERAYLALGQIKYGVQDSEKKNSQHKRSVYVVKDIQVGEVYTKENLRVIRPADGLPPKYFDLILGRKCHNTLKAGTPLSWENLL